MQQSAIMAAATLLADARRKGRPLKELPPEARPSSFAEAAAIQEATIGLLGETVSGYKVAGTDPAKVMWGAVLASRFQASPAVFAASDVPFLGIEAEIAYRLEDDITADDRGMTLVEFDKRVAIVPAIEIVDTRFVSYLDTPLLQRAADLMSNGGLVHGEAWPKGGEQDLTRLPIKLHAGEALIADTVGGHAANDPRLPALAFIQAAGRPDHLPRGLIITTGSYTGLLNAKPGDRVRAEFAGYGALEVTFSA